MVKSMYLCNSGLMNQQIQLATDVKSYFLKLSNEFLFVIFSESREELFSGNMTLNIFFYSVF